MSVFIRTKDQNVIDVNKAEYKVTYDLIHHSLESVPGIPETKGKAEKLERTEWCDDRHFLNVILVHRYLIIPLVEIQLGENCESRDSGGEIRDIRKRITVRNGGGV